MASYAWGATLQDADCEKRAEHGARRVHSAMYAKGGSQLMALTARRNHGVARGGADTLADAIQQDHAGDSTPTVSRNQKSQFANRR